MNGRLPSANLVEFDPGCVKTLRGITAPGIFGPMVMRRAKKNLSSARHYDQIRFRFRTAKTQLRHRALFAFNDKCQRAARENGISRHSWLHRLLPRS